MKMSVPTRALGAALIIIAGNANVAHAEIKDYEFQLVEPTAKTGPHTVISVRLVSKVTGKLVSDAVIFATRLDMAPDSMEEMTTTVTPMAGEEPGIYRFEANVSMAGRWRLSLGAKVQGEVGAVESRLVILAQK